MKARAVLGSVAGVLLIASCLAHAFLGWPALRSALDAENVDEQLVGALAVGWYFGSVAMLVFGIIVMHSAFKIVRREEVATRVIAVAYLAFGLVAYVARDLNPHFLLFVCTGVLVGVFAFWRS